MNVKLQLLSKLPKLSDVPATFVTKHEICTHADALDASKIAGQVPNEGFASLFAESACEFDE